MRTEKVVHDGYVNTRCQWGPGCPDWIKPKKTEHEIDKPEQGLIAKAWGELFPYEDVPDVLSQPCCSQFALSKDRILSIPRERLIYIRDWLLHTDLDDSISGRIFEYTWQALFTNQNVFCPKPHICWCETYGLCFESEQQYNEVEGLRMSMDNKRNQLGAWRRQKEQFDDARTKGDIKTMALLQMPEPGRDLQLMGELNDGAQRLAQARVDAIVRGEHFKYEPKD
ncbi:hypothetical protein KEM55_007051 [Ascosphaera atra]|nr:hypothetical protein KEM55_007051 [Ascosphaera atra]